MATKQPQYTPLAGYGTKEGEWEFTQQGWQPIVSPVSVEKLKELYGGSSDLGKGVVADKVKTGKAITLEQTPEQRERAYKDAGVELPEEKPPAGLSGADILASGGNITDYDQQQDGTYLPKREKTPDELQLEREQAEVQTAKSDYQDAVNQLQTFDISKDPQYQNIIASITSQWDSRIRQMERTNASRRASLLQTGIRLGSRYTEAITGGIITAEEREGMSRIAELESQKQSAITAARVAYQKQEWDKYSDFIDLAEKKYNMEVKEVDDLNKKVMEENKTRDEKIEKEKEKQKEIKARQEEIKARQDVFDIIGTTGATDPLEVFSEANRLGISLDPKMISETLKEMNAAEKTFPGILGEYYAAKESGEEFFANMNIDDFINWKDPTRALNFREQQLRIAKLEKDLTDKGIDEDPMNLYAYAQQYATTGQIPTGLPKGTFGIIANAAKEIPKAKGVIVNKITGVADSKMPSTEQQDYSKLYNIINSIQRMKELENKRWGGIIGGIGAAVFGDVESNAYMTIRKSIIDDMQRMQSGAALTAEEIEFYEDYLPGRFTDTPGMSNLFFQDSLQKLINFENFVNNRLTERLDVNNVSMYGYSKVDIGGKKYNVGDVIVNEQGQQGRVLPDGSISLIETE